jgi:aspartate/methionine/tyrosine aminotransferase
MNLKIRDLSISNPVGILPDFPGALLVEASEQYFRHRSYEPNSQGLLTARRAISDWYKAGHDISVPVEHIVITASTSESYNILLQIITKQGDIILLPEPSYPLIDEFAHIRGVNLRSFPLRPPEWQYNPGNLDGYIDDKVKGLILVSPNNPTGSLFVEDCTARTLSALTRYKMKIPLIIDEVFSGSIYKGNLSAHRAAFKSDHPTIILNGISKNFALPDLKVGWIILNKAAWSLFGEQLVYANDLLLSCSTLNQSFLPSILGIGNDHTSILRKDLLSRRNDLRRVINTFSRIRCFSPSGGWNILFECTSVYDDDDELAYQAATRGFLLHPGYFYNISSRGCFGVISILAESRDIQDAFTELGLR